MANAVLLVLSMTIGLFFVLMGLIKLTPVFSEDVYREMVRLLRTFGAWAAAPPKRAGLIRLIMPVVIDLSRNQYFIVVTFRSRNAYTPNHLKNMRACVFRTPTKEHLDWRCLYPLPRL